MFITLTVLSSGAHGSGDGGNTTISAEDLKYCGANFCVHGDGNHGNLERPPDHEIFEISMIYLACIVAAVAIIAFFLDPLKRYGEKRKGSQSAQELSGMELLSATFRQMKKPNQQLLIPITVFIGMEQAFIGADFTQAYVSCALGIHQIGFVMICFGVVNAICSILFGSVMKYIGRMPIIVLGGIVHFSLISILLFWSPSPDNPLIFFAMSGLWGVGDAVWQTQINGLYGLLFRRNKEAAFSNYRLWESAGFVIAYAYATTLCAEMKLYILLAVLAAGCIGYIIVEILYRRKVGLTFFNIKHKLLQFIYYYSNANSRNKKRRKLLPKKRRQLPLLLQLRLLVFMMWKPLMMNWMIWKRILWLHISKLNTCMLSQQSQYEREIIDFSPLYKVFCLKKDFMHNAAKSKQKIQPQAVTNFKISRLT